MEPWSKLAEKLRESTDEDKVKSLLDAELKQKNPRMTVVVRIYQRYSKLRREREMQGLILDVATNTGEAHGSKEN